MRESDQRARRIRRNILRMSHIAQTPHIGSSLSCVEVLDAVLSSGEYRLDQDHIEVVLSKGHAAPTLYAALAEHGYLSDLDLSTFGRPGSALEEHPNHLVPGVSNPAGSLGHGLPFATGFVLAGLKDGIQRKAAVIMSDGECNEGTVWESAIFAGARGLSGLTVIVDSNKWQATGRTSETFGDVSIGKLFSAAGWSVMDVDGHDYEEIEEALSRLSCDQSKPLCLIAHTVKGRGISFMEDDNNWHYRTLSYKDYELAMAELGQ